MLTAEMFVVQYLALYIFVLRYRKFVDVNVGCAVMPQVRSRTALHHGDNRHTPAKYGGPSVCSCALALSYLYKVAFGSLEPTS